MSLGEARAFGDEALEPVDRGADARGRAAAFARALAGAAHDVGDLVREALGVGGELADLLGDDGEAACRVRRRARPRSRR